MYTEEYIVQYRKHYIPNPVHLLFFPFAKHNLVKALCMVEMVGILMGMSV